MPSNREWVVLVLFVATCLTGSVIGGMVTSLSVDDWYPTLEKPSFTPPDWVFAPVWLFLYISMALAAWLVWLQAGFRHGAVPLGMFFIQLILNVAWSGLFFGLRHPGAAFVHLLVLWIVIVATTVEFWRVRKWAGMLMVPYVLWVIFAGVLNYSLWQLN